MNRTKRYPGVYLITNLLTQKVYVGYSRSCLRRMQQHRNKLRANKHKNCHLQASWNLQKGESFTFNIIEHLSPDLTNKQFEQIETKWVLYYKSHLSEFGYNATLPGSIPLYREEENITRKDRELRKYVCIKGEEIIHVEGSNAIFELTNISPKIQQDLCLYWTKGGRRKSRWGWIVIREEDYDESFDYVGHKKKRVYTKPKTTKTWRDYASQKYIKKAPEDIVPYSERNLKRVPIISVDISTGKETTYNSIKECTPLFNMMKVRKCISNEYGRYKHRGHYFKKA